MTQQQILHQHFARIVQDAGRPYGGAHVGRCITCGETVYGRTGFRWQSWTYLIREELDPQELLTP
jgi:hypothetical protein